jgi:hypothetical protein
MDAAVRRLGKRPASGVVMNGMRALRVVAFMSISVGVGILSHAAWGFVAFGVLVLLDNFAIKGPPPAPSGVIAEEGTLTEP